MSVHNQAEKKLDEAKTKLKESYDLFLEALQTEWIEEYDQSYRATLFIGLAEITSLLR